MNSKRINVLRLTCAALCLALCMVLPFLTGQIKEIGNMLCPMHIPVLLCGFICGPVYAAVVGAIAPLLRFMLFGMPKLFPTGVAMCAELAAYGLIAGVLHKRLPGKPAFVYVALIGAMLGGRIVWGLVMAALMGALPIAIGMGAGAEARRPLGLAVVGGLCFSQLVTLYITPVYYAYMEDFSRWLTRRFGQRFEANRAARAEHEKEEGSHAG